MSKAFKLQDPGEGIREAEILSVLVSEGDQVSEGDPVVEVETDKAAMEVRADFDGTIEKLQVQEGTIAKVGDVLMTYEALDDSGGTEDSDDSEASKAAERSEDKDDQDGSDESENTDDSEEGKKASTRESKAAPSKSKSKRKRGTEKSQKSDPSAAGQNGQRTAQASDEDQTREGHRGTGAIAAPSTRRLAREADVDIDDVEGTGPRGRVVDEDIRRAASEPAGDLAERTAEAEQEHRDEREAQTKASTEAEKQRERRDADDDAVGTYTELERVPMKANRRATAKHMVRAWQMPHVMHHDLADFGGLRSLRREHAELVEDDHDKPTVTAYVVKAVARALGEHPEFNVRLDEDREEIVKLGSRHVGVAVATSHGLLVPVVRHANRLSLFEVARELRRLSEKTRRGDLRAKERKGASITVTNVGGIGGRAFTPIINAPQCSILGVGAAYEEFVPDEHGRPKLANRLPLSFAFDHRLNDGAQAARFVNTLKRLLASPAAFSLFV